MKESLQFWKSVRNVLPCFESNAIYHLQKSKYIIKGTLEVKIAGPMHIHLDFELFLLLFQYFTYNRRSKISFRFVFVIWFKLSENVFSLWNILCRLINQRSYQACRINLLIFRFVQIIKSNEPGCWKSTFWNVFLRGLVYYFILLFWPFWCYFRTYRDLGNWNN